MTKQKKPKKKRTNKKTPGFSPLTIPDETLKDLIAEVRTKYVKNHWKCSQWSKWGVDKTVELAICLAWQKAKEDSGVIQFRKVSDKIAKQEVWEYIMRLRVTGVKELDIFTAVKDLKLPADQIEPMIDKELSSHPPKKKKRSTTNK